MGALKKGSANALSNIWWKIKKSCPSLFLSRVQDTSLYIISHGRRCRPSGLSLSLCLPVVYSIKSCVSGRKCVRSLIMTCWDRTYPRLKYYRSTAIGYIITGQSKHFSHSQKRFCRSSWYQGLDLVSELENALTEWRQLLKELPLMATFRLSIAGDIRPPSCFPNKAEVELNSVAIWRWLFFYFFDFFPVSRFTIRCSSFFI
jgi:hypothetical protein